MNESNHNTIRFVVVTVCLLAGVGVCTEAACAFWKIPDMSGSLSSGFTHCVDTLVGALIALLINTRPQSDSPQSAQTTVTDNATTVTTPAPSPAP